MSDRTKRVARVVSVIAATVISLACGTNVIFYSLLSAELQLIPAVRILSMGTGIRPEAQALIHPEQSYSGSNRTSPI